MKSMDLQDITPETFTEPQQERIQGWRQRPIGQFTLEVYRLHRMRCVPAA
jgi:hypothetical protein